MKKLLSLFLVSGFIIIQGCNTGRTENKDNRSLPYYIDLEQGISNVKSIPLSYLGNQLEYIPLETDTACLIRGVSGVFVSDSFIFVNDGSRLLHFDRNGQFIKQIGSTGRGPGEYSRVGDFVVNEDYREIFILSGRIVLVYNFDGQFIRDIKLDFPCSQFILKDNNSIILHPFNMPMPTPEPVYSWYFIDRTGNIQTKLTNTLKRVNRGITVPTSPIYMFDATPHLMEFGVDTLYEYVNSQKKPYAIFNPGRLKMPPDPTMEEVPAIEGKIWVYDVNESNKSLFVKLWWNMSDSISNCIFDKESSLFTILKENGFVNDIDGGMTFWPKEILNDNTLIDYVDSFDLITITNKSQDEKPKPADSKKAQNLKNLAGQLNETSNPVLVLLKMQ